MGFLSRKERLPGVALPLTYILLAQETVQLEAWLDLHLHFRLALDVPSG